MPVTEDDLRRLLATPLPTRDGCPDAQALAGLAGLVEDERAAVLAHVGRCRDCAEEVQAVAPLEPWAGRAAAGLAADAVRRRAARRRKTPWPATLAAAAALVLAASALIWRADTPGLMRSGHPVPIRSLLAETTPLPRDACRLRWSDVGGGARYSATVLSNDLRPLASADGLERPELVVPPAALQPVPPGGQIVWSVEVRWPDGRRLTSPTFVNRLR